MVDITRKEPTVREARASGKISLKEETIALIKKNAIEKGDVFAVARVAAIQAVKRTSEMIPLCHPIPVEHVSVDFEVGEQEVSVAVSVKTTAKTGVEMEALTGVSAALLTIWDMTKMYEKDASGQYPTTLIKEIRVTEKRKG
ncbi:MAG: cyclic pyranopterin monophosphate synthase MoaC [Candidatus Methanomethyliales bacterium]|nr:cyclic pyranopterin monophosphate synthase MoaC [Candidatus Methanomethylicales archaeon]